MRSWLLENPPPLPDYHPWNLHSPDAEVARAPPHSYQRHAGGVQARACRLHPAPPGARACHRLPAPERWSEDAGDWRLRAATDRRQRSHSRYNALAFSRSTMRASSEARLREISPSRSIPLSAMASARRPVRAAIQPDSSQPISGKYG
jgi:hypothetical protein